MFFSLIFYVRKTTSKQTSGPPKDFVQNYSIQTASCVVSVAKRISSSLINNLTEPVQFRGNGLQAAPSNSQAETPLSAGLPNLERTIMRPWLKAKRWQVFQRSMRCSFASKATLFIPGHEKSSNSCSLC